MLKGGKESRKGPGCWQGSSEQGVSLPPAPADAGSVLLGTKAQDQQLGPPSYCRHRQSPGSIALPQRSSSWFCLRQKKCRSGPAARQDGQWEAEHVHLPGSPPSVRLLPAPPARCQVTTSSTQTDSFGSAWGSLVFGGSLGFPLLPKTSDTWCLEEADP